MALVLLEGVYRVWVEVDADNEKEAYEKAQNVDLSSISVSINDIEDFQAVDCVLDD